jgi:hypothetical protein
MIPPRVPEAFVGGLAALPELFRASAKWRGMTREEVDEVVRLVPAPILELTCFLDRMTGLWRYDYGEPFHNLEGELVVFGANTYNEVDRLFEVLNCARLRLVDEDLSGFLHRLTDPSKHQNFLFEFMPIVRLDSSIKVTYEVAGYGEGNHTIDWLIRSDNVSLLLEVKNRTKDLMESLVRFQRGERGPDGTAPAPTHDPSLLFRSVQPKFKPCNTSPIIQAVWVATTIKQEESELLAAFAKLDSSRVHVAIFGDWGDDVYILANDCSAKERTLDLLGLRESQRAVFRRDIIPA